MRKNRGKFKPDRFSVLKYAVLRLFSIMYLRDLGYPLSTFTAPKPHRREIVMAPGEL